MYFLALKEFYLIFSSVKSGPQKIKKVKKITKVADKTFLTPAFHLLFHPSLVGHLNKHNSNFIHITSQFDTKDVPEVLVFSHTIYASHFTQYTKWQK